MTIEDREIILLALDSLILRLEDREYTYSAIRDKQLKAARRVRDKLRTESAS